MTDPYSVLKISPNASDEEVKNAYRSLAKKYHPDNYANSPDVAELAAEKMTEVNAAYDQIMTDRKNGVNSSYGSADTGSSSSSSAGYNYGYGSNTYSGSQHSDFADVRNLLSAGRVTDAETLLDGVPASRRNAEWYFLKGTVLYRRGWVDNAYEYLRTAVNYEPNNQEYQAAFNQVLNQRSGRNGGYQYQPASSGSGCGSGCSPCTTCVGLICADSCCECCGGDLISCI